MARRWAGGRRAGERADEIKCVPGGGRDGRAQAGREGCGEERGREGEASFLSHLICSVSSPLCSSLHLHLVRPSISVASSAAGSAGRLDSLSYSRLPSRPLRLPLHLSLSPLALLPLPLSSLFPLSLSRRPVLFFLPVLSSLPSLSSSSPPHPSFSLSFSHSLSSSSLIRSSLPPHLLLSFLSLFPLPSSLTLPTPDSLIVSLALICTSLHISPPPRVTSFVSLLFLSHSPILPRPSIPLSTFSPHSPLLSIPSLPLGPSPPLSSHPPSLPPANLSSLLPPSNPPGGLVSHPPTLPISLHLRQPSLTPLSPHSILPRNPTLSSPAPSNPLPFLPLAIPPSLSSRPPLFSLSILSIYLCTSLLSSSHFHLGCVRVVPIIVLSRRVCGSSVLPLVSLPSFLSLSIILFVTSILSPHSSPLSHVVSCESKISAMLGA
ncbi:hypothetical protein C7M84_010765 [Penaeus vannamei]|uniref:Uncharacterized protein n=1 Tax=Penaeus vannamei TaxID=6689 RepID=A0A3R7Q828_PENVA|nr:hypothetical protein C7M84_010765 [Penaeus vannamei]